MVPAEERGQVLGAKKVLFMQRKSAGQRAALQKESFSFEEVIVFIFINRNIFSTMKTTELM